MKIRVDVGHLEVTNLGYTRNIAYAEAQSDGGLIAQSADDRHVDAFGKIAGGEFPGVLTDTIPELRSRFEVESPVGVYVEEKGHGEVRYFYILLCEDAVFDLCALGRKEKFLPERKILCNLKIDQCAGMEAQQSVGVEIGFCVVAVVGAGLEAKAEAADDAFYQSLAESLVCEHDKADDE